MKGLLFLLVILCQVPVWDSEANPRDEFRGKFYAIQEEYLKKLTKHQYNIMEDLESKLRQQKWQTNVIAIVVFVMVLVGLVLSYLQFKGDQASGSTSNFTLRLGSGSVEIHSSIIGLGILALSFWFFQGYIETVYDVTVFEIPFIDAASYEPK